MQIWEDGCGILNEVGLSHVIPGRELSWSEALLLEGMRKLNASKPGGHWGVLAQTSFPGEPLSTTEHGCSLSCRFWNVPGMLLMKWVFPSGFGILLAIITKTGALHMAGKPGLCSAVELEYNFLSKTHSCFITQQKNHIIWPWNMLGSVLCLRKDEKKTTKTHNPKWRCFLLSRKAMCPATLFLPGSTCLKTTRALGLFARRGFFCALSLGLLWLLFSWIMLYLPSVKMF